MSRGVRQGPEGQQERPVQGGQDGEAVRRRGRTRGHRPIAQPTAPDRPHQPRPRNPTGVTNTVQARVLYQGSDSRGVS